VALLARVWRLQFPTDGTAVEARYFTEGYQAPGAEGMLTRTSDYYALGVSIKRMMDLHLRRKSDSASTTQLYACLQSLATALVSDDELHQEAGVFTFLTSVNPSPETSACSAGTSASISESPQLPGICELKHNGADDGAVLKHPRQCH
jgi:hypothetical protein